MTTTATARKIAAVNAAVEAIEGEPGGYVRAADRRHLEALYDQAVADAAPANATAARPATCEQRPYPGAGYHCLEDAGHYPATPHSDHTLCWDAAGRQCNWDFS